MFLVRKRVRFSSFVVTSDEVALYHRTHFYSIDNIRGAYQLVFPYSISGHLFLTYTGAAYRFPSCVVLCNGKLIEDRLRSGSSGLKRSMYLCFGSLGVILIVRTLRVSRVTPFDLAFAIGYPGATIASNHVRGNYRLASYAFFL